MSMGFEPKACHRGTFAALSVVGLLMAAGLFSFIGIATIQGVVLPGTTNFTITASVVSSKLSNNNLQLKIRLDVKSNYPAGVVSEISAAVAAFSDSNLATATLYAQTSFHNVIVSGGQTISVFKTVIVHSASMAAQDHDAFVTTAGVVRTDATVRTFQASRSVDTANLIGML